MSKREGDPGYADCWCVHFRSLMDHDTCEVGVSYDSHPPAARPCFLDKGKSRMRANEFEVFKEAANFINFRPSKLIALADDENSKFRAQG